MTAPTIPGAEAFSHNGNGDVGVLVLHGFTGNPGSMRGLAEACAAAGFHVELPQLAGHGTAIEDMIPTRWADWSADAEKAYQVLSKRAKKIVVMGLSMGGALTLWMAAQHPEACGIVCINPATQPQPQEVIDMLQGMIDGGTVTMDGIGSDIDPSFNVVVPITNHPAMFKQRFVPERRNNFAQCTLQQQSLRMRLVILGTNNGDEHVRNAKRFYCDKCLRFRFSGHDRQVVVIVKNL